MYRAMKRAVVRLWAALGAAEGLVHPWEHLIAVTCHRWKARMETVCIVDETGERNLDQNFCLCEEPPENNRKRRKRAFMLRSVSTTDSNRICGIGRTGVFEARDKGEENEPVAEKACHGWC